MKESVTKFDLEAAFKALDEIETPKADKLKPNRPALTEIFSRKTKFDALMEEYYDINNMSDLDDAKEAREAEVAQAKLARIEKIVDLDAESPEDLLPSYVGKFIVQCPQCMTLFYKDPEDVETSEEDSNIVNVSEVCQHCGNDAGYTLIGKVGEATEEEQAELNQEETVDVDSTDESAQEVDLEDEDIDLNLEDDIEVDLEEIDLDEEPAEEQEEESDKKEESFSQENDQILVEELTEDKALDVSAEEFEKLIKSPEFTQPISDSEVRSMMNDANEKEEDNIEESVEVNNETLKYAVINPDGTYAGVPCTSEEEARELAAQREGRIIVELGALREGIFDKISNKVTAALDKLKTRESKADWILKYAMKDYDEVQVDDGGKIDTSADNKRFGTFVVVGYKNKFSNGKEIKSVPAHNNKNLVVGMNHPELADKYSKADDIAKGWSQRSGNGPAYIYLSKSADDTTAVLVCAYFNGELVNDKVEELFKKFRNDLTGAKNMERGGSNQSDTKKIKASDLKQGMQVKFKDGAVGEVVQVEESRLDDGYAVSIKFEDGTTEKFNMSVNSVLAVTRNSTTEAISLDTFVHNLENLQEASLEKYISDSLIESYGNVAGFRLAECLLTSDKKLHINGNIFFTSGAKRSTSYVFTEATCTDGKISLQGLNEKLGLNKQFTITGYADSNKTFITESFNYTNK